MHFLRHTAVAILISQGVHLKAIKRFLGHSSIVVHMDIYGHLFPSEQEHLPEPSTMPSLNFSRTNDGQRRTRIRERMKTTSEKVKRGLTFLRWVLWYLFSAVRGRLSRSIVEEVHGATGPLCGRGDDQGGSQLPGGGGGSRGIESWVAKMVAR